MLSLYPTRPLIMPQSPKHGPERHWFRVAVFSQSRNKFAKEDGAHMNYQNGLQLDTNQPFFLPISKKFLHAGEIQASKKSLEVCVTKTLLNTTTVLIPHCQVVLHWRMGHTLVRSCKASFALIFAAGRVSLIFNDAPPAVKKGQENDVLLILYLYLYLCPSLWLFQRIVSVWACHQLWQEPSSLCTRPHSKGHHMPKLMKLPER